MESKIKELLELIKQKKELCDLDDNFVEETIDRYFKRKAKIKKQFMLNLNQKSAKYKQIVKEIRAQLRRQYGLFRIEKGSGLEMHASTRERKQIYPQLYKKIFSITGKPNIIIDLGAGMNPYSIPEMKLKRLDYYAYDISQKEVKELNLFFKDLSSKNPEFKGKAEVLDFLNLEKVKKLPLADVCFLFKITDILDQGKSHKKSEGVISSIPARWIVVSFPTKTMSGKKMNFPRRKWIELMSVRLGYTYELIEFENELFYVIKK